MRKRAAVSAVVAGGMLLGAAGTVMAYDGSATVSCDTAYTTNLVTLYGGGTSSVKQKDTSENNNRYYWGVSSNGNSLNWKATTDGGTVTWSNVGNSNYTWKTRIVSNQNCNGILPGNGNSSLSYNVTP
jgi:putative IMPACT (imprinted ancient) family translation regulator